MLVKIQIAGASPAGTASDAVGLGGGLAFYIFNRAPPQIMLKLLIWGLPCEDHCSKSLEPPPPLQVDLWSIEYHLRQETRYFGSCFVPYCKCFGLFQSFWQGVL